MELTNINGAHLKAQILNKSGEVIAETRDFALAEKLWSMIDESLKEPCPGCERLKKERDHYKGMVGIYKQLAGVKDGKCVDCNYWEPSQWEKWAGICTCAESEWVNTYIKPTHSCLHFVPRNTYSMTGDNDGR